MSTVTQPYYKPPMANPSQILPTEPKGCWNFFLTCAAGTACIASLLGFFGSLGSLSFMVKPFDFGFELGFVMLSFSMAALDIPYFAQKEWAMKLRDFCWRYAYIITTCTGRGYSYMLLATWSWLALWDEGGNIIQMAAACGCSVILFLFGWIAYRKGQALTRRLEKVRESMLRRGESSDNYFRIGMEEERLPLTKEQWRALFEQHDGRPHVDVEMDYMMGALSMKPFCNTEIEKGEFDDWLGAPSVTPYVV